VAVSPDGQFAYVANQPADSVSAYAINTTTGALTPVPDSPFAAGRFPTSVTTTAPAKGCKHEERDRDERGDDDEQRDRKHGCRHSGEKDFEEHDNDKMHESERGSLHER
jgi:hypothetical protein